MITTIETLIPINWQLDLLESMKQLPWIHQHNTSYKTGTGNFIQGMDVFEDENTVDTAQFVHYAITGDEKTFMFPYLKPMMLMLEARLGLKIVRMHRIKINCQMPIPNFNTNNYNIAHSDDSRKNLLSAIYYVNDSDGDTFIFNEHHNVDWEIKQLTIAQRITPKMGNVVIFPSTQLHASSNPIITGTRFVINFMFEAD